MYILCHLTYKIRFTIYCATWCVRRRKKKLAPLKRVMYNEIEGKKVHVTDRMFVVCMFAVTHRYEQLNRNKNFTLVRNHENEVNKHDKKKRNNSPLYMQHALFLLTRLY